VRPVRSPPLPLPRQPVSPLANHQDSRLVDRVRNPQANHPASPRRSPRQSQRISLLRTSCLSI
jgi:hypothetical protein